MLEQRVTSRCVVVTIADVKHVWRNQRFHRSDPPPFFCFFRKRLPPHVHQRAASPPASPPVSPSPRQPPSPAAEMCECTLRVFALAQKFIALEQRKGAQRGMSRTWLRLATATPALAALRFAHEHTRAEHARHARTMRAPHHACAPRQSCTCSHVTTRAHVKKLGCRARVTGHWLTVGRLAAGTSGANALCKHARHLRCARGPCVVHTLCLPSTTDVAPYAET